MRYRKWQKRFPYGLESQTYENITLPEASKISEKQYFMFSVVHDEDVMPFEGQTHIYKDTDLPNRFTLTTPHRWK